MSSDLRSNQLGNVKRQIRPSESLASFVIEGEFERTKVDGNELNGDRRVLRQSGLPSLGVAI